ARAALTCLPAEVEASLAGWVREDTDAGLRERLTTAALRVHLRVAEQGQRELGLGGMATTLTLWLAVGARAFVVQVGDSRCYRLRDGVLECLTRDQTMAQDLVDRGAVARVEQAPAGWDNVLTSSVGGPEVEPAVVAIDRRPGDVILVCSDGVVKHVSDAEIRAVLGAPDDAGVLARRLVREALAGGGSDNATAVVVRERTWERNGADR
ncbi:MAG: protein phosphatase 2C domain-containing protein, partial [Longimicrobiales bacterium]|nr:protein phosphatase 2C domain-containing protein [Longimicrobiales bacterium]